MMTNWNIQDIPTCHQYLPPIVHLGTSPSLSTKISDALPRVFQSLWYIVCGVPFKGSGTGSVTQGRAANSLIPGVQYRPLLHQKRPFVHYWPPPKTVPPPLLATRPLRPRSRIREMCHEADVLPTPVSIFGESQEWLHDGGSGWSNRAESRTPQNLTDLKVTRSKGGKQ
jgi:hypothetical protein